MIRNWKLNNHEEPTVDDDSPKIITLERMQAESAPQANRIYFYSDVTKESILNLNRQIDELTRQMKILQFTLSLPHPPRIEVHICSDGGDVLAAMSAVDKIADNAVPVDTYVEGFAASAATLISCAGNKRYISKSSCMLVHQISSGLWGNYMQFQDEVKNLELLMSLIKGVYLKKTKFKPDELEEMLKHDLCIDAEQSLKFGLVDKIL